MSCYLHNIHIRPSIVDGGGESDFEKEENSAVGGFPIFTEQSLVGGSSTNIVLEGLNQIRHLSVPLGLVFHQQPRKSVKHDLNESSVITTHDYDKLFLSSCHHTPTRLSRTNRSRNSKKTKKIYA
jgi:hypothetical protein